MTIRHLLRVFSHACCSCCRSPAAAESAVGAHAWCSSCCRSPPAAESAVGAHACGSSSCRRPPAATSADLPSPSTPDQLVSKSSATDYDQRLRSSLTVDLKDVTVDGLDSLIQHLESRIVHYKEKAAPSGTSVHRVEDQDSSSTREWVKYIPNTSALLRELKEKTEACYVIARLQLICVDEIRFKQQDVLACAYALQVTTKGVVKDTVLPLLVKILEGLPFLEGAALGVSLLAWGFDTLDKQHKNFEDCLDLLKDTVFLLKHTKSMWPREDIVASDLMRFNFHRIIEAAFKAFVIAASCSIDNLSKCRDMVRTFLGAASLETEIKKLKEQIRDLTAQNLVIDVDMNSEQNSMLTKQLSIYRTIDSEGIALPGRTINSEGIALPGRAIQAQEILEILRQDGQYEIIAVCLHGMGGVGKSTLALHVYNELLKQKRFHAYSRIKLHLKMGEKEIPPFQGKILKDIHTNSKSGRKFTEANISDALDGREHLQRAFEKSGGPILLYIDNVQQAQHLQDLLPKVQHLPKGSRLLVTARNEKISGCLVKLGVKEDRCRSIAVNNLKAKESRGFLRKWALSKTENKEIIDKNQALKGLEDELLSQCNGLPLALMLMGSYIAESKKGAENVETWRYVVKSMKEGQPIDGDENNELYARLRISVDVLDKSLRQDLFDMVACNFFFQHCSSRWAVESILGEEGMQNLMDRHILEDAGEDGVGCHDVIQSLVKYLAMATSTDELRVTGKSLDLERLVQDYGAELERIVCLEGAVIRDVRQLNRMRSLRFAVNVRVKMDETPPPTSSLVEIHLPHLKVLELLKMDDGPLLKIRRCPELLKMDDGPLLKIRRCPELLKMDDGPLLKIGRCPELRVLTSYGDVFAWQEPHERFFAEKLTYLMFYGCDKLEEADLKCLLSTSLCFLFILRCNSLATFPPRDTTTAAATTQDLFRSLKWLQIEDCQNFGEIPETIHRLSKLSYLGISGCTNLRHLQNEIGQLRNLQSLCINACPRLEKIPESIRRLSQLTDLIVAGCTKLLRLPDGIDQLTILQSLCINACPKVEEIPESIRRLSQLTYLSVGGCTNLPRLPDGIGHLTNLQFLEMGDCRSLQEIPETIRTLSQLIELSATGCTNLRHLPNGIGHLTNLKLLWLNECPRLQEIPESICRLSQLTYLSVDGCTNLQGLPDGIGHLSNLQSLDMDDCRSLLEIPETIRTLSQLTHLCARGCTNLPHLPNGIGQLTNLKSLRLKACPRLQEIPESIRMLSHLTYLNVDGCTNLLRLPDGIGQLTNLSKLYLESCWRLKMLPEGISLCTSLRKLDLEYCTSLECIPMGVGELTNLKTLDLHGCTSLPRLPDGVFQNLVGSLSSLDLRNCKRLETLPEGISLLTSLKFLGLGNHQSVRCISEGFQDVLSESQAHRLRGYASLQKLPSGMFDHLGRSLSVLYLNSLEGLEMLPEGISLLTSLTTLRLDGCRSLQCIPEGIEELSSLQSLSLRGCTCLHRLPHDMFKNLASSLSELDLSVCGRLEVIPEGISGLTSLIELRLEKCESLRRIPEGIMELPSLQTVNLRGCSSLQEGLSHAAFQILAGSLWKRKGKMSKKKNLLKHLLYMVSL